MKLSDFSIEALNPFITGDESPAPRMSGPDIIKFFNIFGVRDVYSFDKGGLPNGSVVEIGAPSGFSLKYSKLEQ